MHGWELPSNAYYIVIESQPMAASLCNGDVYVPVGRRQKAGRRQVGRELQLPLWEEGKVSLGQGNGPLDKPFLSVFCCPKTSATARWRSCSLKGFPRAMARMPASLDGKRSIALVRSRAANWKLDPKRIGFAGFSAGSSMARSIVAAAGPGDPAAADPIRTRYAGRTVKDFPPSLLLAAAVDKGAANGSAQLFIDLNKARAPRRAGVHHWERLRSYPGCTRAGNVLSAGWRPSVGQSELRNLPLSVTRCAFDLAPGGIQYAINKLHRLFARKSARELDRLVDGHSRRGFEGHHFVNGHSQDVAIHRRHTLDSPVLGMLRQPPVDLGDLLHHALHEPLDEFVGLRFGLALFGV